jgi:hypothetical protein
MHVPAHSYSEVMRQVFGDDNGVGVRSAGDSRHEHNGRPSARPFAIDLAVIISVQCAAVGIGFDDPRSFADSLERRPF